MEVRQLGIEGRLTPLAGKAHFNLYQVLKYRGALNLDVIET